MTHHTTDTQRGAGLREIDVIDLMDWIVGSQNRTRLAADVIIAAERRRLAGEAHDRLVQDTPVIDFPSSDVERSANVYMDAWRGENAALAALSRHLLNATTAQDGAT